MGIYNVKNVLDSFKAGELAKAIQKYDLNDMVFMRKEMEGYLKKHEILEENEELLRLLDDKIEEMSTDC